MGKKKRKTVFGKVFGGIKKATDAVITTQTKAGSALANAFAPGSGDLIKKLSNVARPKGDKLNFDQTSELDSLLESAAEVGAGAVGMEQARLEAAQAARVATASRGAGGGDGGYDGSGIGAGATAKRVDPRDTNGDGKVSFGEGAAAALGSGGGDLNGDGKLSFGEQAAGWLGGAVRGAASGAAAGAGAAFFESPTGQGVQDSMIEKYTPHMIAAGFGVVLLLVLARK